MSLFSGVMGNELEHGTNKLREPQSGSWAICLFCAPAHSKLTKKKRHAFLILAILPSETLLATQFVVVLHNVVITQIRALLPIYTLGDYCRNFMLLQ